MPMEITHQFISAIADGGDSNLVRSSDWNAIHLFDGDFGPLATKYAALASDQTGISGDTETDITGCTISLEPGIWMIWGQLNCAPSSGYSYAMIKTGSSGSGTAFAQAEDNSGNVAGRISVQILPKFVTLSSTTSYHLRGQLGGGGDFKANPNSLGEATFIAALRVDQGAASSGGTSCLIQRTSTQSFSSNPETISFTATDIFDPDGWHDPAGANPERATCPVNKGGKIFMVVGIMETNPTGIMYILRKNGSEILGLSQTTNYAGSIAAPVYLDDNDYVELLAGSSSGGTILSDGPTRLGIISPGGGPSDYVRGQQYSGAIVIPGLSSDADIKPASAGTGDDEFDVIDTSDPITGWTTLGTPTAHDTNSSFASHYYVRKDATGTLAAHGIYKSKSPPFTMTCKISDAVVMNADQEIGLFVGEASPGKFGIIVISHDTSNPGVLKMQWQTWTNSTTFGSSVASYNRMYLPPAYLKIIVTSSTDISCYASGNGKLWTPVKLNHDPSFTVGSAGFAVVQDSSTYAVEAAVDWIRFS